MTILDAIRDRALFGPWFSGDSWRSWLTFLAALFALPFDGEDQAALFTQCTGRTTPPTAPAREGWVIVGRRGGKSRIAALVAVYLACFRDYREHLAPGEVGTLAVIAADRRQARTIMRYINGFFDAVPMLKQMVVNRTRESIELNNRVTIEVHTANFRAIRGYTLLGVIADEVAFWRSEENAANPDTEILAGLRPGRATIPGALLLCISSPYARRGTLWDAYRRHYAQDGDPVLVWQAPTAVMNPAIDAQVIADAYAEDESAARAEYGAEFRADLEAFVSREAVAAVVIPGRVELPPARDCRYMAFVDPAGGSGTDSFTLAIGHRSRADGKMVVDAIREVRPPFQPSEEVARMALLLERYGIRRVIGDRYAGEWPREQFRTHGISYETAQKPKSELYVEALPAINSRDAELPDHQRLIAQLVGLERRTGSSGRQTVDHGPRGFDDVANVVCGLIASAREYENKRLREVEMGW